MKEADFDVAVVGGGMTGVTAAYHAALAGLSVGNFKGEIDLPGGLAANIGEIDGFPALGPVGGIELAMRTMESGAELGVEEVNSRVDHVEMNGGRFVLHSDGKSWHAEQVILAPGATLRMVDIPGAEKFRDNGINQCAWCNGGIYRNEDVVVIGGGDSALQEGIHLAMYAKSITIVTHGDTPRARRHYIAQATNNEKIQIRSGVEPAEVLGDGQVEGLRIRDLKGGKTEDLRCSGIFVYIGLQPNSEIGKGLVKTDKDGFIITNDSFETATPGLFAVGAVRSGFAGRITNALGEGTAAAIAAAANIESRPTRGRLLG
jgi:thioredoxin reductase (NADPH)